MFSLFATLSLCFQLLTKPKQPVYIALNETSEEAPIDKKDIEDIIVDVADKYLGDYVDKQLIADIVTVSVSVLGFIGFFVTQLKYGKFKKNFADDLLAKQEIKGSEQLKKLIDELSATKIDELIKQNEELKKGYETIMKVLVLAQDSSTKGKVALIDYLGSKTKSEEVKEATEKVNAILTEKEEIKQEINSKVEEDYTPIF